MRMYRYVCLVWFLAVIAARADTLKLKDGTVLEGEVTAEDNSSISIYLEFSHGTITQTRRINKADIAKIIRWTPEQKKKWRMQHAYERLQLYRLNSQDSYLLEYYDQTIDRVFQKFLDDYPDSPYASNVTARIADWKAERALVSAGNIKFRGRWSPAAEVGPLINRERGQKMLSQARWLLSERRFESAIPELQVVAYMKEHPELASQAKPLLGFAYQQAFVSLEHEAQQLSNDLVAASIRVAEARRVVNEAETGARTQVKNESPTTNGPAMEPTDANSASVSPAQVPLDKPQGELNVALDEFEHLQDRLEDVTQRMAALELQARDVTGAPLEHRAAPAQPTTPAPSPDSPEVLVSLVAWVKKNWPGMLIALLAILFLMSRFAKD
ncbi:MAG TPA: hypothetical protein VL171_08310 [Verrucomicrobiae bacterium]|nr:hypothetical protein [Verrucomicrobiae bacterium]